MAVWVRFALQDPTLRRVPERERVTPPSPPAPSTHKRCIRYWAGPPIHARWYVRGVSVLVLATCGSRWPPRRVNWPHVEAIAAIGSAGWRRERGGNAHLKGDARAGCVEAEGRHGAQGAREGSRVAVSCKKAEVLVLACWCASTGHTNKGSLVLWAYLDGGRSTIGNTSLVCWKSDEEGRLLHLRQLVRRRLAHAQVVARHADVLLGRRSTPARTASPPHPGGARQEAQRCCLYLLQPQRVVLPPPPPSAASAATGRS